jgi:two-component system response regulator YesN
MRVLIVDDEDIIREGIKSSISWEHFDMTVVGTAEDGEEALKLFIDQNPEIVITDIKMPFIDGLELIERIKNNSPDTYIIIISGYDQFEYAQKALKMGAFDYILKPIEIDYVENLLLKIKTDYDSRTMQRAGSLEILQMSFLEELLLGKITDQETIEKKNKVISNNFGYKFNKVVILDLDDSPYNNDYLSIANLQNNFFDTVKECIEKEQNAYLVKIENNRIAISFFEKEEGLLNDKSFEISNKIRVAVGENIQKTLSIGFGQLHDGLLLLSKSFEEAMECLEYKFIIGNNNNILYENIINRFNRYSDIANSADGNLNFNFDFTNKDLLQKKVSRLMLNMRKAGRNSYLYTQFIVSGIYIQVIKSLKEVDIAIEEIIENPLIEFREITKQQTIELVEQNLLKNLFKIADYINSKISKEYKYEIEKAKGYIKQNFKQPSLSIDEVAKFSNISVSYFSILFKRETGLTFIDYLTRQRIEKAKYFLKVSGYKTYQISELVGYNNSTYFSSSFKKYTGYSPSDYRKNINNNI